MTTINHVLFSPNSNAEADSIIAMQREILAQRVKRIQQSKFPSPAANLKKPVAITSTDKCISSPLPCPKPSKQVLVQTPPKSVSMRSISWSPADGNTPLPVTPFHHTNMHKNVVVDKSTPSPVSSFHHPSMHKTAVMDNDNDNDDTHSLSTVTISTCTMSQAHTPPLHLPTFKPAVGCIRANDFLIRCFVARLRKGVTVIKYGRSRFQKKTPKLYNLMLERDQETLTWTAASTTSPGTEPSDPSPSRGAKRLNLRHCQEVRLASSVDPENPGFSGTAVLRDKCDAADAHKSFALVFDERTLDITSITADQSRMLTEGFSALCYRLHLQKQNRLQRPASSREILANVQEESTGSNRRRCFSC